jgi:hypothetical protein
MDGWMGLIWLRIMQVAGSSDNGNELSGSQNVANFSLTEEPSNSQEGLSVTELNCPQHTFQLSYDHT